MVISADLPFLLIEIKENLLFTLAFFNSLCYNAQAYGSIWVLVCPPVFKTGEGG